MTPNDVKPIAQIILWIFTHWKLLLVITIAGIIQGYVIQTYIRARILAWSIRKGVNTNARNNKNRSD